MVRRSLERLNAHPRGRDAVVAAVWLLLGLALLQLGAFHLWDEVALFHSSGLAFLLLLCASAAVSTQRSSHPMVALLAATLLTATDFLFGGSVGVILIFTDFIYAAFKYGSDRSVRAVMWIIAGAVVAAAVTLLVWHQRNVIALVIAAQWSFIVLVAAIWGWNVRSERTRTRALMAEQHARSIEQLRARIAHDLHDLVANQIAVAALHVEAAKLRMSHAESVPDGVDRSLDLAAHGTTQADRQLRRMIQVLNAVGELSEPVDVSAAQLVNDVAAELQTFVPGDRELAFHDDDVRKLASRLQFEPAAHTRAILRVLRELVANAVKHGRGDILVTVTPGDPLTVTVTNAITQRSAQTSGSGIGIHGAELLLEGTGASLDASEASQGEWHAILTLPPRKEHR